MKIASKAVLWNLRIAPRKVRLVVNLVKGRPVQEALDILRLTNKRAAPVVAKMIKSAVSNAYNQTGVDVDRLLVAEGFVNGGSSLKRWLPRAQGRATQIQKRTSHVTIKLSEI